MRTHKSYVECGRKGAAVRWEMEGPFEKRFWSRVDVKGPKDCWLWKGSVQVKTGYGKYKLNGNTTSSHRIAFFIAFGAIGEGVKICHRCDMRLCCNPNHLFRGSHQDNMADMVAKGRQYRPPKGEDHHNAKLTNEQSQKVRELSAMGFSQRKIATLFGVSRGVVQYAIHSQP